MKLTSRRRMILFKIHSWVGMKLSIILFLICFSGAMATLSHEMDWLFNADIRVQPEENHVTIGAIYNAVKKTFPENHVLWIAMPQNSRFAVDVVTQTPEKMLRHVYVNPYTGIIQGSTSYFNIQRFFRSFHFHLFMPNPYGSILVSSFGFLTLISLISGMIIHKRWYRKLFSLTFGRGRHAFYRSLHRLIGAWSIPFLFIIAITGIWYLVEDLDVSKTFHPLVRPKISKKKLLAYGPAPQPLPLDTLYFLASKVYPEMNISTVFFEQGIKPVRFLGQAEAILVRDRANLVHIDPFSGEVLHVQKGHELDIPNRIVDTADPLHFGTFGGLPTKILYFIFGLGYPVLVLTGAYSFFKRISKVGRVLKKREARKKKIANKGS